jgi:rhodanese-related sulfurtransferase
MRSESSMGRGVVTLVLAGAVLGVLYNGAGRMSHPRRGVPWLAERTGVADLDTLALPARTTTPPAGAPAATPGAVPDSTARAEAVRPEGPPAAASPHGTAAHARTGAAPTRERTAEAAPRKEPAPPAAPARSTAAARPPDSSTGASAATTPLPSPATAQPAPAVPYIPASDKPVRISLATTKILFDTGAALFIDARDLSEYQEGHIPGALRMSRDDALGDPDRVKSLPVRGRPIVAYCDGGECEASLELAQALVDAGYRKVLVDGGGFPEWAGAGYPVAKGGDGK